MCVCVYSNLYVSMRCTYAMYFSLDIRMLHVPMLLPPPSVNTDTVPDADGCCNGYAPPCFALQWMRMVLTTGRVFKAVVAAASDRITNPPCPRPIDKAVPRDERVSQDD